MRSIIFEKLSWQDWVASGAGSGFISPANGTWGSLFGLGTGLLFYNAFGVWALIILTILALPVALFAIHKIEQDTNLHDPSWIVADEILAVWLIICFIPINTPLWILACFIGFRVLDILKPYPISKLDRDVSGAWGVMVDDFIAAFIVIIVAWGGYVGFDTIGF